MKRVFLVLLLLACVVSLEGFSRLRKGSALPVYTYPEAPADLSGKLRTEPWEQRFERWYQELPRYETDHKRLTDTGRGLLALAAGILLGTLFLHAVGKAGEKRAGVMVWSYWTLLWAIPFPLTMRYYRLRHERGDFPPWDRSIASGMSWDFVGYAMGFVFFTILLCILMVRYRFGAGLTFRKPEGRWGWTRMVVFGLWILVLLYISLSSVREGDEGMVISCAGAIPVLLLALGASRPSLQEVAVPASKLAPEGAV